VGLEASIVEFKARTLSRIGSIIAVGNFIQFGSRAFIKDDSIWQPAAGEITMLELHRAARLLLLSHNLS
jgi:hypothetical protein